MTWYITAQVSYCMAGLARTIRRRCVSVPPLIAGSSEALLGDVNLRGTARNPASHLQVEFFALPSCRRTGCPVPILFTGLRTGTVDLYRDWHLIYFGTPSGCENQCKYSLPPILCPVLKTTAVSPSCGHPQHTRLPYGQTIAGCVTWR